MTLPEVDQLRCFVAAAEALNFRRASAAVHLTPAALGKQVKRLEERLDRPLFVRSTRRVQLTPDGERFLVKARAALEALAACTSFDGTRGLTAELTVGSRQELARSWLLPACDALEEANPGLNVHLYIGSGTDLLRRLRTGDIDCAVTSARLADPSLDFERIHDETYVFVASPALLRRRPLSKASDAAEHTLVDIARELPLFRYWRDAAPMALRLQFGRTRLLGGIALIRDEVVDAKGVAVLPEYFVQEDLRKRRLVRVLSSVDPHADTFRLVFRKSDGRQSLFREIATFLQQQPLR